MSPTRLSRLESAMRVVLEFNEAFNRHDVAGMMLLMSRDSVDTKTSFHHKNKERAKRGTIFARSELGFWKLGF
jgi:hypothetical protein